MTTDPIRSALAAAGCTREDARKIVAFLEALRVPSGVIHTADGEAYVDGVCRLAAAIEEAARDDK